MSLSKRVAIALLGVYVVAVLVALLTRDIAATATAAHRLMGAM